jgi:hypothetical protein
MRGQFYFFEKSYTLVVIISGMNSNMVLDFLSIYKIELCINF